MTVSEPPTDLNQALAANQDLERQLATRQAELAILHSIQAALAAKQDLDTIFDVVGEGISQIFPGKGVSLFTYDVESDTAVPRFVLEDGVRHRPPPIKAGPIGRHLATTKQPLLIPTRAEFNAIGAVTVEGTQESASGIFAPMIVNAEMVGSLSIESLEQEHAFSESDLALLTTLAHSLSLALDNARLIEQLQRSNQALTETVQQQSAVSDILRVMASMPADVAPVLQAVAKQAGQLCQADDVQVYQVVGDHLRQVAHAGPLPGLEEGESLPLVPGLITGRAVLERRTIVTEDAAAISAEEYPQSFELQLRLKHRSVVSTPMIREGEPVGAIVARRNEVRPFTDTQVGLLATLADQAAIAIENVRLFHETKRLLAESEHRAAELQIINSVQAALSSKLDIQEIYDAVGEKLHEIFPEPQVVDILHYDPQTDLLHPRFVLERGQRYQVDPWKSRGFRKHVIETGQPLAINHDMATMAEKYDNDWVVLGEMAKSFVAVPMKIAGQAIGVISLQNLDLEGAFSASDVSLLETLASSMSVALENARLFDETQRLLTETEQRAAELQIINSVQQGLASKLDIQAIYDLVGDKLRETFEADTILIAFLDETRDHLLVPYYNDRGKRSQGLSREYKRDGIFGHMASTRRPVLLNTAEEMAELLARVELPPTPSPGAEHDRNQSYLQAPIFHQGEVIGAVSVQSYQPHAFDQNDLTLLETLTNSMSAALENARLLDETQRLLKETQQRAAELQIINSVQEGLASRVEMQAIYDLIGDKIREIFGADTTFIAFHDRENNRIVAPYYNDHGDRTGTSGRPYGTGLAEVVIESGAPLILNTSEEMAAAGAVNIASPGSEQDLNQSFLGVPIFREGEVIGVTSVQSYQPSAFDTNDLTLLQTLTNSMSVALENARLFDETQRLLKETEQRAAELATINAVGQALVAESELDALINLIGDQVRHIFAADIVYIALLDPDSQMIEFPYTYGDAFEPLRLGEGLTSKILETGQPLLINREMDQRRAELGVAQVGKGASSYLGVPIQMGERTFGVISAQSLKMEGRFDENDLHLLNTIAANVGTALRNAQLFDEIKRQKQYYQAVIENSPAAIVLLDMQANVTGWNPAAERLFGYQESEALGKNVDELVAADPEIHREAVAYSEQAINQGGVSRLVKRTRKDGSFVEVDMAGVPVDVDGQSVGFIAIYHDVTELQQARQAAEDANRAKSTFLANMSHELRTPLNAIIGFTRIVRRKGDGVLPEKQVENLDKVLVSADHLLNLINSVLDIAKIEAGRMDVKPTSFKLAPLVDLVLATTEPLVRAKVKLTADVPEKLPELITDQDMVKQILINLLSNAAKFTEAGRIELTARQRGALLAIEVSDTGIGISQEALARIFEEFQQADLSTTRQYGGTGLGLSISRSLAQLLGGDLTATSRQGEGSTFSLTLPLHYKSPPLDPRASGHSQDLAGLGDLPVILAIDDDPNVHDLLREELSDAGYQVVAAVSGEEGLRLARQLDPYAITLDVMMPGMDGWQVLSELKADPNTRAIPVVLLTIVDRESLGYQLGASDYLVKPLEEEAVVAALRRLAEQPPANDRSRLLVVDNDPHIHELVSQLLEGEAYTLEGVRDGQQALASIRRQPPDVMLLDLMMPRMGGLEVIEALRQEGFSFPIIVLTAKSLTADEHSFLDGSVESVILKNGLDREMLFSQLRETMQSLRERQQAEPAQKRGKG